jgi:hypothetical protein
MSMHESIFEDILYWPVKLTGLGIACDVDLNEYSGQEPEEGEAKNPCDILILSSLTTSRSLIDAVAEHMREGHGEIA